MNNQDTNPEVESLWVTCRALEAIRKQKHGSDPNGMSDKVMTRNVLTLFCRFEELKETPPQWVMEFIASGVRKYLDGSRTPWPAKGTKITDRSWRVDAFAQYVHERLPGILPEIAEHMGCSVDNVYTCLQQQSRLIDMFKEDLRKTHAKTMKGDLLIELSAYAAAAPKVAKVIQDLENATPVRPKAKK